MEKCLVVIVYVRKMEIKNHFEMHMDISMVFVLQFRQMILVYSCSQANFEQ